MTNSSNQSQTIARYSAIQAMSEMGVGSFLHAMHLPLVGHLLSMNQVFCLTLVAKQEQHKTSATCMRVSGIVAFLKLFSPLGKRIMPMIAILFQGGLFSLCILLFGRNRLGIITGASLASVWAWIQPLLAAYVLFGQTFFMAIHQLWLTTATALSLPLESGVYFLWAVVAIKALASGVVAVMAWAANEDAIQRYLEFARRAWRRRQRENYHLDRSPFLAAFLDLLNPLYVASLLLCLFFTRDQPQLILQTIVLGYGVFLLIRHASRPVARARLNHYPTLKKTYELIFGSSALKSSDREPEVTLP